jgi:hypothetical protein
MFAFSEDVPVVEMGGREDKFAGLDDRLRLTCGA